MKKHLSIFVLFILNIGCNHGKWLPNGAYRPKHPHFEILKEKFTPNSLIDTNFLYISLLKYSDKGIDHTMYDCVGFYGDGRMIGFTLDDSELEKITQANSWETAYCVGHYTTEGNHIKYEYFVGGDGGQYLNEHGLIKEDVILIGQSYDALSRGTGRIYKRLVKSDTYRFH